MRGSAEHVAQSCTTCARGFVIHHNTDVWGDAVPIDGVGSGIWPMGGAWLSLHVWDHYDFTRDRYFLSRRAYPILREAAQFLLDYMVDDGTDTWSGPSISPENRYCMTDDIGRHALFGSVMDIEITHALFSRAIQASEILGIDADLRQQVQAARDRLPASRSASTANCKSGRRITRSRARPSPRVASVRTLSG